MSMNSTIEIRHPYVNEVPAELLTGIEAFKIDPEWQWVLVHDGKVKAQLLAAPMHGVLMMLRLTALPDAPHGWGLALFRRVLSDCKDQGMLGYMTVLDDAKPSERKLMRIIMRTGGYLVPVCGAWAAGRMDQGY